MVITGAWVSDTVTVWITSVAALSLTSATFQAIVVVPTGYGSVNSKPSLLTPTGSPTEQLSVALALTVTVAEHSSASASTF